MVLPVREFHTFKWEFYPPNNGAYEIHTLTCAEGCEAMVYAMEVDVENAAGAVDVVLMLHWDEADFHIILDEWVAQGPLTHHAVELDRIMPVAENSNFHLKLSNTCENMKVTFRVILENFRGSPIP